MLKIFGVITVILLVCAEVHAQDAFDKLQCGANIPQALIGKHLSNGPSLGSEQRHKDLGLKDLGASEISDRLPLIEWQICGKDFQLIVDNHDLIRDALAFPSHSRSSPEFGGECLLNGHEVPDDIIAVLDNSAGYTKLMT